jgi:hypothetical protein
MRRTLIAIGIAAVLATTGLAAPAQADEYQDPLTAGDLLNYNHETYALSIAPLAGSDLVTRYGHRVAATYSVRVLLSGNTGDSVIYSGKLGYYRTAYLRLKTVSADTVRDYGIRTYLGKVTSFTATYAKQRVVAHTVTYRHRTLRTDVRMTAEHVAAYVKEHGSTAGIGGAKDIVLKSDGFFGYENATIRVLVDTAGSGSTTDYVVYGYDPTDGYQALFDSATGTARTATSTEDDLLQ